MTTSYKPPSVDLLTPKINDCPLCDSTSVRHKRLIIIKCTNNKCNLYGPNDDPQGHKWNSIPRRLEVKELLRLVDEVTSWDWSLINTSAFPEDGKQMCEDLDRLKVYADKLRKDWNL